MQVRTGVEMLAALAVVLLAAGGADGMTKCELKKEMTAKLPTKVLNFIKKDMAEIICSVEMMSGFNTSLVKNITLSEKQDGVRYARSAPEASSEESSEKPKNMKPGSTSTTVKPTTATQANTSSPGSSTTLSGNSTSSLRSRMARRRVRSVRMGRHGVVKPTTSSSPVTVKPHHVTLNKRSPKKSSMESDEDSVNSTAIPSSSEHHRGNNTSSEKGNGKRRARSTHKFSLMAEWSTGSGSREIPHMKPTKEHMVDPRTKPSKMFSEESNEESHEESNEESSEESKEEPSEESSEESKEEPSEESSEETKEEPSEESSEESKEESKEESSEESKEESKEESSEESKEEPSEESDEESSEESHEEPTWKPTEKPTEKPTRPFRFNYTSTAPIQLNNSSSSISGGRVRRNVRSVESESSDEAVDEVWTLYGLFQLPGQLVCSSGSEPTLNLCNMPCTDLLNDDITDDIACVGTLISDIMMRDKFHVYAHRDIRDLFDVYQKKECANQKDNC